MLKLRKKNFILLLITIFVAGILMAGGALYGYLAITGSSLVSSKEYESLEKFAKDYQVLYEVNGYVEDTFLWDTDIEKTKEDICTDIVRALGDPYSEYMNKKAFEEFNEYMSGKFSGVGLSYTQRKGDFIVLRTIADSPAEAAGFKAGDIIKKVDGKRYKTMEELQQALKGPQGTEVTVNYERNGKPLKCTMIRDEITLESVASAVLDDNIGYIAVSAFERETGDQFLTELSEMENKNVKGLIIDLRYNGGGYVTESLKVADALLPACTLTSMVDKKGNKESFDSKASSTDLPYVILVNESTASASEILAGAVQDNEGGKIIGTKTYGKGIVQSSFPLSNGGCVKLTTMEYLTPDGHHVHKKGITPDIIVKPGKDEKKDVQLEKAIKYLTVKH